ncbi:MAG: hypothetical protein LBD48_09415 [Treponema sp.]|nr:hypothetical protein [Treponema sp.]
MFDRYIASLESDGTCTEGLSYWTYGVGFYVCMADILFYRTARFQQYCYFPGGNIPRRRLPHRR